MSVQSIKVGGVFKFQHIRDGVELESWTQENMVTDQGVKAILDFAFDLATPQQVYVSIFEGNVTPGSTLTAADYPAFCTEITAYESSTRPAFTAVNTANVVSNEASLAEFVFTTAKTVRGAALLIGDSAKGGVSGKLLAIRNYATARDFLSGDIVKVSYSFSAVSA